LFTLAKTTLLSMFRTGWFQECNWARLTGANLLVLQSN